MEYLILKRKFEKYFLALYVEYYLYVCTISCFVDSMPVFLFFWFHLYVVFLSIIMDNDSCFPHYYSRELLNEIPDIVPSHPAPKPFHDFHKPHFDTNTYCHTITQHYSPDFNVTNPVQNSFNPPPIISPHNDSPILSKFSRTTVRAILRYQCCCDFADIDYEHSVGYAPHLLLIGVKQWISHTIHTQPKKIISNNSNTITICATLYTF